MTTRLLPREEWHRLEAETQNALALIEPDQAQVVVVENGDQIVGVWAVLRIVHLEGVWIAPEYRKGGSVARRLMKATMETARAWAPRWVMTGAQTPEVAALLTKHMRAVHVPMETYIVPTGDVCR